MPKGRSKPGSREKKKLAKYKLAMYTSKIAKKDANTSLSSNANMLLSMIASKIADDIADATEKVTALSQTSTARAKHVEGAACLVLPVDLFQHGSQEAKIAVEKL